MPFVDNEGVRIHYQVYGKGFPIVMHSGAAGDGGMWLEAGYVEGLHNYQCILIDPRGHGLSGKPHNIQEHRLEHYLSDVMAVLDALEISRVAFWGYAEGGHVGFALAARYPERVAALIVMGDLGEMNSDIRKSWRVLARDIKNNGMNALIYKIEHDENITLPVWMKEQCKHTDPEMFALELQAWMEEKDAWPSFPKIQAPVLLIVGDKEDTEGKAKEAKLLLSKGQLVVLPGVTHYEAFLLPGLVLPKVRSFLHEVIPQIA